MSEKIEQLRDDMVQSARYHKRLTDEAENMVQALRALVLAEDCGETSPIDTAPVRAILSRIDAA